MAFWGKSFSFDGLPCEAFDLMIYDIGNSSQSDTSFASVPKINDESIPSKWKPLFYGTQFEKKLEFEITFGVDQQRIDGGKFLDRSEINNIAAWLTGYDEYKSFHIDQDDMMNVHYKCIVTSLQTVSYGRIPWALKAKFTCDSPYAYLTPEETSYSVSGSREVEFLNKSGHSGFYMPILKIEPLNGGSFSVLNMSDGGQGVSFTSIPASISEIVINNDTGVISNDQDLNLYPYFGFKFLRLQRGLNKLRLAGNGIVKLVCEFPVNTGG